MSSPPEHTVLVLDPSSLPQRLEEALGKRSFFVELAESSSLSATLLVSTPDLILAPHAHMDEACRAVRASREHGVIPLMIVAPRGALAGLRHQTPKEVSAVVSSEMPCGAIAVRAQTILKRALAERGSSARKDARSKDIGRSTGIGTSVGQKPSTAGVANAKKTVPSLALEASKPARRIELKKSLAPRWSAQQTDASRKLAPSPLDAFAAQSTNVSAGATSFDGEEVGLKAPKTPTFEPALREGGSHTEEVSTTTPKKTSSKTLVSKGASLGDVPSWDTGFKATDEKQGRAERVPRKPTIAKTPTRVSLEMPATALPGLRVALLDEDVTRADALSTALREAGHKVFLVSNTSGVTRWSLLRRFGPQVILVDELSLARDGGNWLSQFRADPFLKQTALVAHPLSALFNERSGETNLSPLMPQLEGLGRVELALLAQLSPHREILVPPNQMNLARLLVLLEEYDKPCEVEMSLGEQVLRFSVHGAKLSCGNLRIGGDDAPGIEMSPDDVLAFCLDHPEASVVVQARRSLKVGRHAQLSVVLQRAHEAGLPQAIPQAVALSMSPAAFQSGMGASIQPPDSLRPLAAAHPDLPPPGGGAATGAQATMRHDSEFPTGIIDLHEITSLQERSRPSGPMPVLNPPAFESEGARGDLVSEAVLEEDLLQDDEPTVRSCGDAWLRTSIVAQTLEADVSDEETVREQASSMVPSARVTQDGSVFSYERPFAFSGPGSIDDVATSQQADSLRPSERAPRHTPPGFAKFVPEQVLEVARQKRPPIGLIGGALAALLVGALGVSFLGGEDQREAQAASNELSEVDIDATAGIPQPEPQVDPRPTESGEEAEAKPEPEEEAASLPELYRITLGKEMQSCEELLKQPLSYYASKPRWEGQAIWKRARRQLVLGEKETAHQLMCQAAYIDRAGPASVGLASFYLAHRSVKHAKEWALYGIEQRKDYPRKSQELLGDALSQLGKVEEARDVWLETLKLNLDNNTKLRAVARTLTSSAGKARRGGDYPLAERLLRRATVFDDKNVRAAAELAVALLKNGQPELAERWAKRALSLDETSSSAHFVLGELAFSSGDHGAAKEHLSRVHSKSAYAKEAESRLGEL